MTTHTEPAAVDSADAAPEPDYRFTLANERTFLAWIRTAFGLLAGGVAVEHLLSPFASAAANTVISVGALLLAIVLAAGAFLRWRAVQRAMVLDRPLPSSPLLAVLAAGTGTIAAVSLAVVALT